MVIADHDPSEIFQLTILKINIQVRVTAVGIVGLKQNQCKIQLKFVVKRIFNMSKIEISMY